MARCGPATYLVMQTGPMPFPDERGRPRAAVVVLRDQEVLLVWRRRQGRVYCVLPGGGVEPGETSEQAAWRELDEETSLSAERLAVLVTATDEGRTVSYFLAQGVSGNRTLGGPEWARNSAENRYELRWTPLAELPSCPLQPPSAQAAIALATTRR